MEKLPENWLLEEDFDLERNKYLLLSYLKAVQSSFQSFALYPKLMELVAHLKETTALDSSIKKLEQQFPKKLKSFDLDKLETLFVSSIEKSEYLKKLEEMLSFAIPSFNEKLGIGKSMFDFIESQIMMELIGLAPIQYDCGYALLKKDDRKQVAVYHYKCSSITDQQNNYFQLSWQPLWSEDLSFSNTPAQVKQKIIQSENVQSSTAVYLLECSIDVPFDASFVPIAKRMILREVGKRKDSRI